MTAKAILHSLGGLPRAEAVKALSTALTHVVAGLSHDDLPGEVERIRLAVPMKSRNNDKFQPVWDYLATVKEYSTLDKLRADLVGRFGEACTPSRTHLHRYLQANRTIKREI